MLYELVVDLLVAVALLVDFDVSNTVSVLLLVPKTVVVLNAVVVSNVLVVSLLVTKTDVVSNEVVVLKELIVKNSVDV